MLLLILVLAIISTVIACFAKARLPYLVLAIIITVLILVIASAQFASTCTWSLIGSTASPVLVLLQVAGLGAVMGSLLVLFWKTPKDKDDEVSSSEVKGE